MNTLHKEEQGRQIVLIDRVALMEYIGQHVRFNSEEPLESYSNLLNAINNAPVVMSINPNFSEEDHDVLEGSSFWGVRE